METPKAVEAAKHQVKDFQGKMESLTKQIGEIIVGNTDVVRGVVTCLLANSHALLEGVPGLGKTMLVKTLAEALDLKFSRIQFTPDLMPADIIGTTVMEEAQAGRPRFEFQPGPIFADLVLADEINRATPKTQSALLEAMQERHVTVGRVSHELGSPYLVMATQNPLEMEGTYPLPEAQLDRFFFKLQVPFPSRNELREILKRTTSDRTTSLKPVLDAPAIRELQQLVRTVPVSDHVTDYAVRCVLSTHPETEFATPEVKRFVRTGVSPRGAQALLLAARINALFEGRFSASIADVRLALLPALRHRLLLNFEGEAEGIKSDELLENIERQLTEAV